MPEPCSVTTLPQRILAAIESHRAGSRDPIAAFFYDMTGLATHARELKAALPDGVELYYAIKANSEMELLDTLAPIVDGFELSSGGEIARAGACSRPMPWVLSGPGKLDSELEAAIEGGIEAFHVESLHEISRLQRIAKRAGKLQAVFLRINPELPEGLGSRLKMAGTPTPFGLDEADLADAVAAVEAASHLALQGFHIHAMSHQMDVSHHRRLIAFYLSRWPRWCSLARNPGSLTHLNVGGGIGVNYTGMEQFDWSVLCRGMAQDLSAMNKPPRLRFEIGRFISAFCGYYAIEVLDRKTSHGEGFLVCRGGTHQFRLPAAQGHDHPVIHLPQGQEGAPREQDRERSWTVVGQLCTPKDVLSRQRRLQGVAIGDVLVLPLAGAYGYNISHADFLCHPRPAQVFV